MKNRAKIAFFLQDLAGGGAEKMMVHIANKFHSLGYDIDLVLVRAQGPYLNNVSDGINIIDLNIERTYKSFIKYYRYLNYNSPIAIFTTLPHMNILSIIVNLLSFNKTRVIVREASPLMNYTNSKFALIKLSAYSTYIFYYFSYKCVAISEGLKEEIQNRLVFRKDVVMTIYNPVITDHVLNIIESTSSKIVNDDSQENIKYIITAGRLEKVKDFETLIRAFSKIKEKINAKLLIAGEGSQINRLKQLVKTNDLKDDVEFLGFVDNLTKYMLKSDLFILSSKYEGFGNVLVEALVCNLQIVSTNCPYGPSEILENGKYGSLVTVGDHEAMARESIQILKGKKRYLGLRERAMDFHVDKISEQYLNVILNSND